MTVRLMESIEVVANDRGRFEVIAGSVVLFNCDTPNEADTIAKALELLPLTMGASMFVAGAVTAIRRRQLAAQSGELEGGSRNPELGSGALIVLFIGDGGADDSTDFPPCPRCGDSKSWTLDGRENFETKDQETGATGANYYHCLSCGHGKMKHLTV